MSNSAASSRPVRPELLAPAGDWECARAAVENGADAIYFGLDRFNARMRATNFTTADLPALMEFLHRRGVRGYVTFNTLVFPSELEAAAAHLRQIIAAGVDAAIVQDIGVCRLIRRLSPDFPIHASTQMSVTSAAGVRFARDLGCNLVVLARECSLREISLIHDNFTDAGSDLSLPLEIFVHGALCVAYSGQCLTSEALGGRSANRGECAQACRMPYELIADGQNIPLEGRRYLLSPQDLAGLDALPDILRTGLHSLKIEGRLKTPEYVAAVTSVYRRALDNLLDADSTTSVPAEEHYRLEMKFSRGLYPGWLQGNRNQELVHARHAKKRGVLLGHIHRLDPDAHAVVLRPTDPPAPLRPGDGVVLASPEADDHEQGGRLYTVRPLPGGWLHLAFARGHLDFRRLAPGQAVWKTSDPVLDRDLRRTFTAEQPQFHRPVHLALHGHTGAPLLAELSDDLGHLVRAESALLLAPADNAPLTDETLRAQFARLGPTGLRLATLENHLQGQLMLPLSEINRLRRDLARQLLARRSEPLRWILSSTPVSISVSEQAEFAGDAPSASSEKSSPSTPALALLVRTLPQLEAALDLAPDHLYCEFEDPKKYREAVRIHRAAAPSFPLYVAPPRMTKPGEEWILKIVRSSEADGYLVRNYDHLEYFHDQPMIADFSFNIANALAAAHLRERAPGLRRLTASYDLNARQLGDLLRSAPPQWFEVTLHQHIPMFHMEHCVFCAFLSTGQDYRDCGRPCESKQVRLRDRVGVEHHLRADAGCRNTLYHARAQTGAEHVPDLLASGLRNFRIELLADAPADLPRLLARYRALLSGQITGTALARELGLHAQLGVTWR